MAGGGYTVYAVLRLRLTFESLADMLSKILKSVDLTLHEMLGIG